MQPGERQKEGGGSVGVLPELKGAEKEEISAALGSVDCSSGCRSMVMLGMICSVGTTAEDVGSGGLQKGGECRDGCSECLAISILAVWML